MQHHNSGDVSNFFTQRLISKLTVQYMKNLVNLSGGLNFIVTLKLKKKILITKKKETRIKIIIFLKINFLKKSYGYFETIFYFYLISLGEDLTS